MRPSSATLLDPSFLKHLGSGAYAKAFLQADGTVLKISKSRDGSMDFIEWCWLRMKKFGKGSVEMVHLPEVEHFGLTENGWWAVMPRYTTALDHGGLDIYGRGMSSVCGPAVDAVVKLLTDIFSVRSDYFYMDLHWGNVMWDPKRAMWVITDPLCDDATGTADKLPQVKRFKTVAAWKQSPLQRLARA